MNRIVKKCLRRLAGERIYRELQSMYWANNIRKGTHLEDEVAVLPQFIKPGDHVVDIGGHYGTFAYPLSTLVGPTGCVYSFEPVLPTFRVLQRTVQRLGLSNVQLFNNAMSDTEGIREIKVPKDADGLEVLSRSRLSIAGQSGAPETPDTLALEVQSLTLDGFVASRDRPAISFVKCDVEGAELLVFKGARDLLKEQHPAILCEIEEVHTAAFDYVPGDLISFMREFDYRLHAYIDGQLSNLEDLSEGTYNYFFLKQ